MKAQSCQTVPELMMLHMGDLFKEELILTLNKMQMDSKLKDQIGRKIEMVIANLAMKA